MPKEIKSSEGRFLGIPPHVFEYIRAGATVYIEKGAGEKSGFLDEIYRHTGVKIVDKNEFVDTMSYFHTFFHPHASMVLKVKEILREETNYFLLHNRPVMGFGHLASNEWLTKTTIAIQATYLSLEDIVEPGNPPTRPVLAGMSKIAGEEAVRIGMKYMPRERPEIIIVGYGHVGKAAHRVARGEFGLAVTAIDPFANLTTISNAMPEFRFIHSKKNTKNIILNITDNMNLKHYPEQHAKPHPLLFVLAPYAPENKAPVIVTNEALKRLPANSVIVDVSIDQGGACEFSRVTTHENPVVELERGIKYIGISNLPGGVPKRSTPVFSESVFPYMMQIIKFGFINALKENPALRGAVSIYNGKVTSKGLAQTFGLVHTPIDTLV